MFPQIYIIVDPWFLNTHIHEEINQILTRPQTASGPHETVRNAEQQTRPHE